MPGVMPGFVGKGPIFAKLDALLADPAKRPTFLTRISKKKPNGKWDEDFLDVLAAMLPLSTPREGPHRGALVRHRLRGVVAAPASPRRSSAGSA